MGLEVLVPLLMGALLQVAGRVGEGALGAVEDAAKERATAVFDKVKSWFAKDPPAAGDLDRFVERPNRYQSVIQDLLIEKLTEDPAMREELAALVAKPGPEVEVFQTIAAGNGITGAKVEEMISGRLSVTQKVDKGENVVGADIKRLGG